MPWRRDASQRWPATPGRRLVLAIILSVCLHLFLLMLQFGEYGEGLPGLNWPGTVRRAVPDIGLEMRLMPAPKPTLTDVDASVVEVAARPAARTAPVAGFDLVPMPPAVVIPTKITPHPSNSPHHHGAARRLLTVDSPASEFTVAVTSVPDPEIPHVPATPAVAERETDAAVVAEPEATEQTLPPADRTTAVVVPLPDMEQSQALARRSAVQEEALKADEQFAAMAGETTKLVDNLRQQEQAANEARLRAEQQEQLLSRQRDERERREQQMRDQVAQQERQDRQVQQVQQVQQSQQRELAALHEQQMRQQQIAQQAEQQTQQQLQQRLQQQLQRQLQQERLAQQNAQQQQTAISNSGVAQDGLDPLTGEPLAGIGKSRRDLDKILAGRSADFDRSGSIASSALVTSAASDHATPSGGRRSIFGSKTSDVQLTMYRQGWRQKIERNGRLNYSQSAKDRMHTDPVVTVAVRSDGSVESVVILRSSGRPEMDEAVRRIAMVNAPYSAFPPGLAGKFDVIEIRQVWIFDDTLKTVDEM